MKIEKHLGLGTPLSTQSLPNPWQEQKVAGATQIIGKRPAAAQASRGAPISREFGFNLQLNQQLSALQASDQFLAQVSEATGLLKVGVSRALSNGLTPREREREQRHLEQLQQLLQSRHASTGGSLDANLRLKLTEPARSRLRIEGLETLAQVQAAGDETLVFSAGRHFSEALAVSLSAGSSAEEILRRFNASLAQENIRVEASTNGDLVFSLPERDWHKLAGSLRLRGDGGLAPAVASAVNAREEQFINLPEQLGEDPQRQLRPLLDELVGAGEQIGLLREQIQQRQADVRAFLANQPNKDDQQWADFFSQRVSQLSAGDPRDYPLLSQLVSAQSHVSRATVVSLLS